MFALLSVSVWQKSTYKNLMQIWISIGKCSTSKAKIFRLFSLLNNSAWPEISYFEVEGRSDG